MDGFRPIHWAPAARREDREAMLQAIGVKSVWELYSDVPEELLLREPPRVGFGKPLSELELGLLVDRLLSRNTVYTDPPPFIGGGWCPHFVPALVDYIVSRPEFFTAYTPYQAEINQGILQALFEYQSLIADLTELEVVNASLYDGSTAAAEAFLMAVRATRRKKIIIAGDIAPWKIRVIETWLYGKGIQLERIEPGSNGVVDPGKVDAAVDNETAAVYLENPSFTGALQPFAGEIADIVHRRGGLFVLGFEPLSLGIVKPPGRLGADIAVAEGQPLGLHMNYGGPGLGVFAVRWDKRLIRQIPGRIIGLTRDSAGRRAFTMILQTREQHIRREKATSNITTNEALMAIAAAVYLTLLGGKGLQRLARSIWLRSHYLARRLNSLPGVKAPVYSAEFFKEFTVSLGECSKKVYTRLRSKGILFGLDLEKYGYPKGWRLLCVTELHSRRHLDTVVEAVREVVAEGC